MRAKLPYYLCKNAHVVSHFPYASGPERPKDQTDSSGSRTKDSELSLLCRHFPSDHIDRTRRMHRHGFGDASHQYPIQPAPAM